MYGLIGGKSPIAEITKAQAKALEEVLNKQSQATSSQSRPTHPPLAKGGNQGGVVSYRVYVGMRYWHPFIEDVLPEINKDGIRKLVALSLYPQYSVATSGSSLSKFKEVAAGYKMETFCVSSWHNHPLYIEALADVIKKGMESFSSDAVHVLFSAHSLPQKIIDQGDPYVDQTIETINEITKKLHIKWHLSYQSKSGPVKWLEPSTGEKLEELARNGLKNVLVVPISFVSDHIETLYEIDILYKNLAEKLGMRLKRTDSLNTHPKFIDALKDIVEKNLKETGQDKFVSLQ